jgi:hypothetical protein
MKEVHENMKEIIPENDLERSILESQEFHTGSQYISIGKGHEEKIVGVHITQILDFIDRQPWEQYRDRLRLIGLLHDLGKVRVVRNEKGGIIGNSHSQHSEEIAQSFTSDQEVLYCIRIHDKYIHFMLAEKRAEFKPEKFLRTYQPANLDLLIRFNYADSNNRERDSIKWFEDACMRFGLRNRRLYEAEPTVLQ